MVRISYQRELCWQQETRLNLIAAEQIGRRAHLIELDPLYYDVIVSRYEQFISNRVERVPGSP
jgi:DNA modification methylase